MKIIKSVWCLYIATLPCVILLSLYLSNLAVTACSPPPPCFIGPVIYHSLCVLVGTQSLMNDLVCTWEVTPPETPLFHYSVGVVNHFFHVNRMCWPFHFSTWRSIQDALYWRRNTNYQSQTMISFSRFSYRALCMNSIFFLEIYR